MRGLFVTGTGTGVGKSVLTAAIVAALVADGRRVAAFKPVVTGIDDEPGAWPSDHELLARVSGDDPAAVAPLRFGPAVSPHLAAELAGVAIDPAVLLDAARAQAAGADLLIAEGVGGLLVPLAGDHLVRDFAVALGLPIVIAAHPDLGTINHVLLTLEAARSAGLTVRAVVLGPWPGEPSVMQRSNRATIESVGAVEVATLPFVAAPDPAALAAAGAQLQADRWC